MKPIGVAAAAAFAVFAAWATPSAAQQQFNGYATATVNQRTGPGVAYSIIQIIPAGAPVRIYGCLSALNWCDTRYSGRRGWVNGRYLEIFYNNRRRPIMRFGFSFGLPMVTPWWNQPGHALPPPPHKRSTGPHMDNGGPGQPPGDGGGKPPPKKLRPGCHYGQGGAVVCP